MVTRDASYAAEDAEKASSPLEALDMTRNEAPFIIGGGEIYRQLFPHASTLHLTLVDTEVPDADTFIDINPADWKEISREGPFSTPSGLSYSFITFTRTNTLSES